MRAILKEAAREGARLAIVETPKLGPNDLLVKVGAAAICGADINIYYWTEQAAKYRCPLPFIFGHEMAGEVVEIGSGVEGFNKGDKIAVETHVPCTKCELCLEGSMHICEKLRIFGLHINGAFAEYAVVPNVCAYKLPENVTFEQGAVFEPFGVGVHAVTKAGVKVGDAVAVLGCGPIGLFTILAARTAGASEIVATDISSKRLELAESVGATAVFKANEDNTDKIKLLTRNKGLDVVFETSGAPASLQLAMEIVRIQGMVVVIGDQPQPVSIDFYRHSKNKETKIFGLYGRLIWDTWKRMANIVGKMKVNPEVVVTHKFSFEDMEEAFRLAKSKEAGKILLIP